ncbi:YtxH domain-containing protein [Ureibacillus acetophenoni]|uniref:Gas vesicle protein n=1 Tax=Ureibacillus acetophenoni TaxID=614649 RepID=A0A285U5F0_9BACL|nr:YtxH domain-containing protein [Ureibacillus acetophenoni]SOC36618.1 gas vesicle protein [Ureibacillus acetophenoni]
MTTEKPNYNEVKNQSNLPVGTNDPIYREETINIKDFIIGSLVGGMVGAAVGLLLAPKAGRDLRTDVANQALTIRDKGVEISTTAKEKTVKLSNQLKEQSVQLVDKVKSKSSKVPTVFYDGTVSAEGEEPIELIENEKEGIEISDAARPSSI